MENRYSPSRQKEVLIPKKTRRVKTRGVSASVCFGKESREKSEKMR